MSIFISHSHMDKDLADILVDLLNTGLGIPHKDIYCSSIKGLGTPTGRNIIDFIKKKMRGSKIVIMLISKNFMNSPFCQNELGVAVFMEKERFPILIPPVTYTEVVDKTMLGDRCSEIQQPGDLDGLARKLTARKDLNIVRWNTKRDDFLREIAQILQSPTRQSTAEQTIPITFRINVLNILSFAKDVHNAFQSADIAVINMVLQGARDLSCATDRGRISSLITFKGQWDTYKKFCDSIITPKVICNILQRERQVDESFQFIKQTKDSQLQGIIGSCENLYKTIKNQIDEYTRFHSTIDKKSEGGFVNSIRGRDDAAQLYGETSDLSKNVKDVITSADRLILEMIDSLL